MLKSFIMIVSLGISLYAQETLYPSVKIEAKGIVHDIMIDNDLLYIATDVGIVQVYDIRKKTFVDAVKIPKVKDFVGDAIDANIFSVDYHDGALLFLSDSGVGGYSDLWLLQGKKRQKLVDSHDKKSLIKARFVDQGHVLLGYLGNEVALLDIASGKELYRVQLAPSRFSDFALNEDHTQAVFACESGVLNLIDTQTGKVIKVLEGINRDNVLDVDFQQGIVSGAGKDKRAALYDVKNAHKDFIKGDFFIYATALSPDSKYAAFAMNEANDIEIFHRQSKQPTWRLSGANSTVKNILFKEYDTVVATSNSPWILFWSLNTKKEER